VPAVALFVQRAAAIDASFALDAHNAAAVGTICIQLDGLPLAIELAAARIRLFSPADLLARLDRRFALLSHGLLDSPQRHRSLAAVLDWSHALLSPAAGQLLAALSVFRGGATLAAMHALFNELDPCLDDVLNSLLDHHLVAAHSDAQGNRRFTMLETVRIYAAQRLADSGRAADVARAHAMHFTGMAEDMEAGLRGPQQTTLLDRLQAEHDNLRAALQWSITNDAILAHRLSAAMSEFWMARGHLSEASGCMDQVLALPNDRVPAAGRAKALQTASRIMWRLGEFSKADALLMQVLEIGRDLDDPSIICRALNGLAGTRDAMGHPQDAVALLHEALPQAQRSGSGFVVAAVLMNLGHTLISLGEHARAQTFIEQSRTCQQALADACGDCHWLMISGHLARTTGDAERAQVCYEESLNLARSNCNWPLMATALSNLGQLAADRNALPEAAALIDQCLAITRAHGLRGTAARALICRARLALSQGHPQQADDALAEGLALYGPACNEVEAFYGLALSVRCAVEQGTMQQAGKQLGTLLAMPPTRLFGVRAALVTEAGALVAMGDDKPALAVRALAAAGAARHRAGAPLYDSDRVFQEQVLDVLRANVGSRKFEVLWTNGQRCTIEALLGELHGHYDQARVSDLVET
jgi:tetratricopeptide (TPR) repeat protein